MKQVHALELIRELDGKSKWYVDAYGKSTVLEATRTVLQRKSSTQEQRECAERIRLAVLYP